MLMYMILTKIINKKINSQIFMIKNKLIFKNTKN